VGICDSNVTSSCSWGNLTYNQWLTGSPLMYPLPGMDINPVDASYTLVYEAFTSFNYPTEAWYYAGLAG